MSIVYPGMPVSVGRFQLNLLLLQLLNYKSYIVFFCFFFIYIICYCVVPVLHQGCVIITSSSLF